MLFHWLVPFCKRLVSNIINYLQNWRSYNNLDFFFTIGFSICWPVCFPPKAYKNSAPFPWFFGTSMCSSLLLFPSIVWYPLSISGSRIPRVFNTKPLSALEYEKLISNRKYDIIFLHSFSHLKYAHKTRHIYVMSYHAVIFLRESRFKNGCLYVSKIASTTPILKSYHSRAYLPSNRGLFGSLSAASWSFSQLQILAASHLGNPLQLLFLWFAIF